MGQEYIRETYSKGIHALGSQIIFSDFMEDALHHETVVSGDGSAELSTEKAYMGSKSLKLRTRVTEAAPSDYCQQLFYIHTTPSEILSIECMFMFISPGYDRYIEFTLERFKSLFRDQASIRYDVPNDVFQYFSSGPTWVNIPDSDFDLAESRWHHLVFQFNLNTKKYISFTINSHFFDLSTISSFHTNTFGLDRTRFFFKIVSLNTHYASAYFDNLVISSLK